MGGTYFLLLLAVSAGTGGAQWKPAGLHHSVAALHCRRYSWRDCELTTLNLQRILKKYFLYERFCDTILKVLEMLV